jgi:malonate decarboxylase beta subunit
MNASFAELSARARLAAVVDAGTFQEWLPPSERVMSPHLAQLGVPAAFDDGVAIGRAALAGRIVFVAAQEGEFMGGGVGEVHGAKLVGLLRRALRDRPDAVVFLAESGGVRLHEANAGLIAVSEVMRALLDVRAAGIATVMLIGGANGCFGGMGIAARCADTIVMSDIARHAMSGPEVIESSHGAGEFDSRDRALVWRTTGGKHRWLSGDCDVLVDDDPAAFRAAALAALDVHRPMTLAALQQESALLQWRTDLAGDGADAVEYWSRLGVADAGAVPDLDAPALRSRRPPAVAALANGAAGWTGPRSPPACSAPTTRSPPTATSCAATPCSTARPSRCSAPPTTPKSASTSRCARRGRSCPSSPGRRAVRCCCWWTPRARCCAAATSCWASTGRWHTWAAAWTWRAAAAIRWSASSTTRPCPAASSVRG